MFMELLSGGQACCSQVWVDRSIEIEVEKRREFPSFV
jgi:hypothetical protein